MESVRRTRRSYPRRSSKQTSPLKNLLGEQKPWHQVIESLEKRLLLRTPIPDMGDLAPAKPGPHDHAPVVPPTTSPTGQQRWPINFQASHVRELAPETIDPRTGISPPSGRVLDPANIVWINRGLASDNFSAIFGTFANQARAVVDAVIVRYEQMIGSFDYPSAGQTYSLTLSMAAAGSGFGASASLSTEPGRQAQERLDQHGLRERDRHQHRPWLVPRSHAIREQRVRGQYRQRLRR
jgi:hypothetical protein